MTVDLYEGKNMLAVITHFLRLRAQVLGPNAVGPRKPTSGIGSVFDREQ